MACVDMRGRAVIFTTVCSSYRGSPYKREWGSENDRRPSSKPALGQTIAQSACARRRVNCQTNVTKIVQGWPKLRDLAQHFDWKSLLEPKSWPTIWANPVQFSFGPVGARGLLAPLAGTGGRGAASLRLIV
jgi:hypothetical protein